MTKKTITLIPQYGKKDTHFYTSIILEQHIYMYICIYVHVYICIIELHKHVHEQILSLRYSNMYVYMCYPKTTQTCILTCLELHKHVCVHIVYYYYTQTCMCSSIVLEPLKHVSVHVVSLNYTKMYVVL